MMMMTIMIMIMIMIYLTSITWEVVAQSSEPRPRV